ncbi:hypothetical protein LY78DRAFT_87588 [Colletotrichum sublineola]|nr:hypothetical protein LY78DRAFT_87588 [Colletotrichum sublineola]
MNQTAWVFPCVTLVEGCDNNGSMNGDYYSGEYPDIFTNYKPQICTTPVGLQTVDNYGQVGFGNSAVQHGFEQPTNASVSRYSSSPTPFLGEFMVEPSVTPELSQQTVPTTSAPVQQKVDSKKTYAELIHEAIKGTESGTMVLQDLYKWFVDNAGKPKNSKGWQKSIRHNLSMNDAFKKVKKAWTLNSNHLETVKPTSSFRKRGQSGSRNVGSRRLGTGRSNDPTYVTPVTPYPAPAHDSWRFGSYHLQNPSQEESEYTGYPGDPGSVGTMASVGSCPELEIGCGGIWMAVED